MENGSKSAACILLLSVFCGVQMFLKLSDSADHFINLIFIWWPRWGVLDCDSQVWESQKYEGTHWSLHRCLLVLLSYVQYSAGCTESGANTNKSKQQWTPFPHANSTSPSYQLFFTSIKTAFVVTTSWCETHPKDYMVHGYICDTVHVYQQYRTKDITTEKAVKNTLCFQKSRDNIMTNNWQKYYRP